MVYVSDQSTKDEVSEDELVKFVNQNVNPDNIDSIMNAVPMLAAYNNQDVIGTIFKKYLENYREGSLAKSYTPQSYPIAVGSSFLLRMNLWTPCAVRQDLQLAKIERTMNSIDVAHDHNFNLLTIGHFGPGYNTDLFEYDERTISGFVGEKVDLTSTGSAQLSRGKVILFEQNMDIHIQHAPESISASLNLVFQSSGGSNNRQYVFDTQAGRISSIAPTRVESRTSLLGLAFDLNKECLDERIMQVANRSECPYSREVAHDLMIQRYGEINTS